MNTTTLTAEEREDLAPWLENVERIIRDARRAVKKGDRSEAVASVRAAASHLRSLENSLDG